MKKLGTVFDEAEQTTQLKGGLLVRSQAHTCGGRTVVEDSVVLLRHSSMRPDPTLNYFTRE